MATPTLAPHPNDQLIGSVILELRKLFSEGQVIHVTDWAGQWVFMLGRGVGLAQAGGMLSLEPEATMPAREGGSVPLRRGVRPPLHRVVPAER